MPTFLLVPTSGYLGITFSEPVSMNISWRAGDYKPIVWPRMATESHCTAIIYCSWKLNSLHSLPIITDINNVARVPTAASQSPKAISRFCKLLARRLLAQPCTPTKSLPACLPPLLGIVSETQGFHRSTSETFNYDKKGTVSTV